MAHKDRKIQKKRGSRTSGHGGAKKHRGAGSRGGRGMSGSKKHKWSKISKIEGYFGKKGFKRPQSIVKKEKTINVGYISDHLEKFVKKKIASKKDKSYEIDLKKIGYGKLLGSGKITKSVLVSVDKYSKKALEKIEAAGGKIISKDEA